jgi:microcystin degradation protein MlrC
LDFHGNVTARIARAADILVGYNSFPHTNLFETGQKAADWQRTRPDAGSPPRVHENPAGGPMERMTIVGDEPMMRLIQSWRRRRTAGAF